MTNKKSANWTLCIFLVLILLIPASNICAQEDASKAFTFEQVIELLKNKVDDAEMIKQIEKHKVDFELTTKNIRDLVRANASDKLIDVIENNPYSEFRIDILKPSQDDFEVGIGADVAGTAYIPDNDYLWVLLHRTKGFKKVWWPQGEAEIDPKTKAWELHVNFGQPQDIGYEFEIAVITVNKEEHEQLEKYWFQAMKSGDWRSLYDL